MTEIKDQNNFQAISQEVRNHHRLFIWAAALVVVFVLGVKIVNHLSRVADINAEIAKQKVQADKDVQKAADDHANADRTQYDRWKEDSDRRIDALYSKIDALSNQLHDQQEKDRTMPMPDVATRWQQQVNASPQDIKPAQNPDAPNSLFVTEAAARKTVVLLDELPVDRQQLQSQQQIIAERDADILKQKGLLGDAGVQLAACKTTQKDSDDACKKQITKVKADARRGKIKVFFIGAVTAVVAIFGGSHKL